MKKLILLFLSVSLLACSAGEEIEEDRGTFRVPSIYRGFYENTEAGLYLDVEEYKIEFNMPNGEVITITRGMNMGEPFAYLMQFDDKMVFLDKNGSRVLMRYSYLDNSAVLLEQDYEKVN